MCRLILAVKFRRYEVLVACSKLRSRHLVRQSLFNPISLVRHPSHWLPAGQCEQSVVDGVFSAAGLLLYLQRRYQQHLRKRRVPLRGAPLRRG